MKWWAFNEEQLEAALNEWIKLRLASGQYRESNLNMQRQLVRDFLKSPQARAHKLRGDNEQ